MLLKLFSFAVIGCAVSLLSIASRHSSEAGYTMVANCQQPRTLSSAERTQLLKDREAVWRAFFANDVTTFKKLVPPELIAIDADGANDQRWSNLDKTLEGAKGFAQAGGKLVRLEFPRTEIQAYCDVAIIYTTYLFELEIAGKRETSSGFATEIFVRRNGVWVNPGWHMDSCK